MPGVTHLNGTGSLWADHSTDLGAITYGITLLEATDGTISILGYFRFTATPQDVTPYPTLFIQLENGGYISITLKHHDSQHNSYAFTGHGPPIPTLR